jgi:ABC-type transporter Mla subunit MlaD
MALTHGRTRKRWAERAVIVLLVIAGAIFFVAWAIGLALLILLLTY